MNTYLGKEVGISDWLAVDQALINDFGRLTKDEQWIHSDPERSAAYSPFKSTIAHGFLGLSFASHFAEKSFTLEGAKMGMNYGFDKIRFTNVVPVDSKIRGRFKLIELERREEGAKFKMELIIEIQGIEKPAVVAEWIALAF